jgi:hypothetical protein
MKPGRRSTAKAEFATAGRFSHHSESGSGDTAAYKQGKAMDDAPSEITQLDDFQVIAERRDVAQALAALTNRYRQLNQEMNRRETLRWMLP